MRKAASIFVAFLLVGILTSGFDVVRVSAESSIYVYAVYYRLNSVTRVGPFYVTLMSNSSVSDFHYNQSTRNIGFNVTVMNGTVGFCNVTIPKMLLCKPWSVLEDETEVPFDFGENETCSWLFFTYANSSRIILTGSYSWSYELINPNKAVAAGEKVFYKARISNYPDSSLPLMIAGRGIRLHRYNTDAVQVSSFDWDGVPWLYTIPVGETRERTLAYFVIRQDPWFTNESEIDGEVNIVGCDGTPTSLVDDFSLVVTSPLIVETNISPTSLNATSEDQWITANIELPDGYNLTNIDATTIQLNVQSGKTVLTDPSVAPEIGDYDADNTPDLMVKFPARSLISLVNDLEIDPENVTLKLTGRLANKTTIYGRPIDEIPIESTPFSIRIHTMPCDINWDGKVDIFDIVEAAMAYQSTPSDPKWNPHCDIAEPYGIINIFDIVTIAGSYGEEYTP